MKTHYLFFTSFLILALHFFGNYSSEISNKTQRPSFKNISDQDSLLVKVLDLSDRSLTELNPDILKYKNIEELILDDNRLTALPEWISEFKNLRKISIKRNSGIDIFKTSVSIEKLKKLEELNISECGISSLPYQLSNLYALKRLYASKNNLVEIPYHIGFLSNLEVIDVSDNVLREFGHVFSALSKLKVLELQGNSSIDFNKLGESISLLQLEQLGISHINKFPEVFSELNIEKLCITNCSVKEIPEWFSTLPLKKLEILYPEDNCNQATLLSAATRIPTLVELNLKDCSPKIVSGIIPSMKNIKYLSLAMNNLNSADFLSASKQLENLDLRGNQIDKSELRNLKSALPNCTIVLDQDLTEEEIFKLNPPIANYLEDFKETMIIPNRGGEINGEETKLLIPANAFLDENGKVVTSPVKVKLREFNNVLDIAFSGIPMKIKAGDSLANFASAGMIEIRAESNGKEVFPNPEQPITARISSDQNESDYNVYALNDKTAEWEIMEEEPTVVSSVPLANFSTMNNLSFNNFFSFQAEKRPFIAYQKIQLRTKNHAAAKSFTIGLDFLEMHKEYNCAGIVTSEELDKLLSKIALVYNGKNSKKDRRELDSIGKVLTKSNRLARVKTMDIKKIFFPKKESVYYYNELNPVSDISIAPDFNTDDFVLSFKFGGENYAYHVYPYFNSLEPEYLQKKNKLFYAEYLQSQKITKKEHDKAMSNYLAALERFERDKQYYIARNAEIKKKEADLTEEDKAKIASRQRQMDVYEANQNYLTREFEIQRFGVNNLDKLYNNPNTRMVLATYNDENNNELDPQILFMCDLTLRGTFYLNGGSAIKFDPSHRNMVVLLLDENTIGIVSPTAMKNMDKNGKVNAKLIDTKTTDKSELYKIAGIEA